MAEATRQQSPFSPIRVPRLVYIWVTGIGMLILVFMALLSQWQPHPLLIPLYCVIFGALGALIIVPLARGQAVIPGVRVACLMLTAANVLCVITALLGLSSLQAPRTEALGVSQWGLTLYIIIYSLHIAALVLLVPLRNLPRIDLLRLSLDALLVMSSADVALRLVLPRLVPGWTWTSSLLAVELRLVTTLSLAYWFIAMCRRFGQKRNGAIIAFAVGLGVMVLGDGVLFLTTYQSEHGASFMLLNALLPFQMVHQLAWAIGLLLLRPVNWTWQQRVSEHVNRTWSRSGPLRQMLVIIALGTVMYARPGSLNVLGWFIFVIAAHQGLAQLEQRLIQAQLAAQAADLAIANSNLAAANVQLQVYAQHAEELATERERTRIAREIHDGLGHFLTGINMHVQGALGVLDRDPSRAREPLRTAQALTKSGLAEVRRSVSTLRSTGLDRPIVEALQALVQQAQGVEQHVIFSIQGTPDALPSPVATTIYRIAQEALTNIRKYAPLAHVKVTLDYTLPRVVQLIVADDGPGSAAPRGGYGLPGMHERAEAIGGTVTITTAPDAGFTVRLEVPR